MKIRPVITSNERKRSAFPGGRALHGNKRRAGIMKLYVLMLLLSLVAFNGFAATRYAVASGNWNSTAVWSASSGGAAGASVPVAGDIVNIGYTTQTAAITV